MECFLFCGNEINVILYEFAFSFISFPFESSSVSIEASSSKCSRILWSFCFSAIQTKLWNFSLYNFPVESCWLASWQLKPQSNQGFFQHWLVRNRLGSKFLKKDFNFFHFCHFVDIRKFTRTFKTPLWLHRNKRKASLEFKFFFTFFSIPSFNHKRFYFPHILKNTYRRLRLRLLSEPFSIQHFSTKIDDWQLVLQY